MAKPLRVGVIGASPDGSWGSTAHLPALTALAQFAVTAVSTTRAETAARTAAAFGIRHAFDDPRRLAEHPDVDLVVVAVRVPEHRHLVQMALDARKHVYCEWPLGRNVAEATELADAADASGVVHMTGLQARRAPAIEFARELIAEGVVGQPVAVNMTHSVPWTFRGRSSSRYLLDRQSGATYLTIPGGHSLDCIAHLVGEFSEIRASLATLSAEATGEGIEQPSCDQAIISGIAGDGAVTSLRLQGSSRFGTGVRLELSGTHGDIVIESAPGGRGIQMADLTVAKTSATGKLEPITIPDRFFCVPESARRNPALNVAKAYLAMHDAITRGTLPSPDFREAVKRHRLLEAVQLSSDSDRTVKLETAA